MESGTSDLTVVPNQEGAESSMVLDPSIQASLQRTSSVVSQNIAIGDALSAGVESSLPVASSKHSEITEAEEDPSPGMEPSLQTTSSMHDPAKDKQSAETGSTSSPQMQVNPFMKDLLLAMNDRDALQRDCDKLKQKLRNGLQKDNVVAFLEDNNMTEAQEKVQELFYLLEAIDFVILAGKKLCEKVILPETPLYKKQPKRDPNQLGFKADFFRIDIYYHLFIGALIYATKLRENRSKGQAHPKSMPKDNLSFEATDFMVFLINKVQEEDIMDSSLALEEAKTVVTKCVQRYEEETISTFICLVVNGEDEEAEDLFKSLLKHMKPSDIINRGRVYNYSLQKAQELLEVYTLLSDQSLSQRFRDVVQCNNRLNGLAMVYDNQVKVQRFLVGLYLKDVDLKQKNRLEIYRAI